MDINNQTPTSNTQPESSTKKTASVVVWIIVIIVIAVGAYLYMRNKPEIIRDYSQTQSENTNEEYLATTTAQQDTTSAIQKDIQSIDTSDIDSDLKNIDNQLNNL